jgi:hypothetical protein
VSGGVGLLLSEAGVAFEESTNSLLLLDPVPLEPFELELEELEEPEPGPLLPDEELELEPLLCAIWMGRRPKVVVGLMIQS